MTREPKMSDKEWPENLWEDISSNLPILAHDKDDLDKPSVLFTPNLDGILDAALDERQQKVIRMRYEQRMTYQAIGDTFGIGVERVRQIKWDALIKLRKPKYYLCLFSVPIIDVRKLQTKIGELTREKEELEKLIEFLMSQVSPAQAKYVAAQMNAPSDMPIHELALSIRILTCLTAHGINTVGELLGYTRRDLQKIRNLGAKSVMDIENALNAYGYELKPEEASE